MISNLEWLCLEQSTFVMSFVSLDMLKERWPRYGKEALADWFWSVPCCSMNLSPWLQQPAMFTKPDEFLPFERLTFNCLPPDTGLHDLPLHAIAQGCFKWGVSTCLTHGTSVIWWSLPGLLEGWWLYGVPNLDKLLCQSITLWTTETPASARCASTELPVEK